MRKYYIRAGSVPAICPPGGEYLKQSRPDSHCVPTPAQFSHKTFDWRLGGGGSCFRESDWDIWKKRGGTSHPPLFTTTFLFVVAELDNSKLDLILWISGWADELLQHWMLCFSFRHISKVGGNTSPDLLTHWKSVTQYLIFDIYYCL